MTIYGLDFTSRPDERKPITCASGSLDDGALVLEAVEAFPSFSEFEAFLARPGPWCAGFDFPFGQPRKLLTNLGLPSDWAKVVTWFTDRSRDGFVELLDRCRSIRAKGDKQHRRQTDVLARSCSPMGLVQQQKTNALFALGLDGQDVGLETGGEESRF